MRAGRDIFDAVDEAFETQRYDRFAAFVFLNDARCTNHRIQSAPLCDLGLNTCLLQFACADLNRRIVVLFAFIDGDIVHPHGVLLRRRRCVWKAHRVAVKTNAATFATFHGSHFGILLLEIDVFTGVDRRIFLAGGCRLRCE